MAKLHRVTASQPGIQRVAKGRGFTYLTPRGARVTDRGTLTRIRDLAIPPAWSDVWICTDPRGHLQATGTDTAGRRQYLYHPDWRVRRDTMKFRHIEEFAEGLPAIRRRIDADLHRRGMPAERVLACAVKMLDEASFRIGSETYAETNGSFGLATLRKRHVQIHKDHAVFEYTAKSGVRRVQTLSDQEVLKVLRVLKDRRGGGPELLAYRDGSHWHDVKSTAINAYLRENADGDLSAKDFRTWQATILAAVKIAEAEGEMTTVTSKRKIWGSVIREVADYLGNTPAVARNAYVDPRVFERFQDGITIATALRTVDPEELLEDPKLRTRVEAAVLKLLAGELSAHRRAA